MDNNDKKEEQIKYRDEKYYVQLLEQENEKLKAELSLLKEQNATRPTEQKIKRVAETLYDKIDEMARDVDSYDFGLPMTEGRSAIIQVIKTAITTLTN